MIPRYKHFGLFGLIISNKEKKIIIFPPGLVGLSLDDTGVGDGDVDGGKGDEESELWSAREGERREN